MSVLKNLRSLSEMEFYKNAWRIRTELTLWMAKDFGLARRPRSVQKVIKDISLEDKATIDEIFVRYGKNPNKEYSSQYPQWFIDFEINRFMSILSELIDKITSANSIYPVKESEADLRRCYQDEAIGCCYRLYQELQYFIGIIDTDLNYLVNLLEAIEREIELLKGWRTSDNKKKKSNKNE